eukprot:s33_g55.t1
MVHKLLLELQYPEIKRVHLEGLDCKARLWMRNMPTSSKVASGSRACRRVNPQKRVPWPPFVHGPATPNLWPRPWQLAMPGFLVPLSDVADVADVADVEMREAFQLPDAGETTLGRRSTCSIVCADETVSGLHCTIFSLGPGDFELEDASRNGTYWNDARLLKGQRVKLKAGGILSLSPTARPGTCFRLDDRTGDKTSALRRMSAMEQDDVLDAKVEGEARPTEVLDASDVPGSKSNGGAKNIEAPAGLARPCASTEAAQTELPPVLMRSSFLSAQQSSVPQIIEGNGDLTSSSSAESSRRHHIHAFASATSFIIIPFPVASRCNTADEQIGAKKPCTVQL